MLQADQGTGYFTHQTRLSKVHRSRTSTDVVAGTSSSARASSTIATTTGTITGTRFSGYLLVRVGGGKRRGTGDSILTGTDGVPLPGGTSARR